MPFALDVALAGRGELLGRQPLPAQLLQALVAYLRERGRRRERRGGEQARGGAGLSGAEMKKLLTARTLGGRKAHMDARGVSVRLHPRGDVDGISEECVPLQEGEETANTTSVSDMKLGGGGGESGSGAVCPPGAPDTWRR